MLWLSEEVLSPHSRHHRQGMGWHRTKAPRNVLWEESVAVAALLALAHGEGAVCPEPGVEVG